MVDLTEIKALSQQIAEKFQPERIILFGSYAYGQPNEDSDVDLLVILPFDEMPVYTAIAIRRQIKPPFPLDLIARTPEQIQQRGLFSEGWTEQQILENYPTLNTRSIQAVFAFAAECLKEDVYYTPVV